MISLVHLVCDARLANLVYVCFLLYLIFVTVDGTRCCHGPLRVQYIGFLVDIPGSEDDRTAQGILPFARQLLVSASHHFGRRCREAQEGFQGTHCPRTPLPFGRLV
jgi:hypothetical protein